MGLWTSARKNGLGGAYGTNNWLTGNGEVLVKLVSATSSVTQKKKHNQIILKFVVLARAPGSTSGLGETKDFRYCLDDTEYPDAANETLARFITGFAGVRIDEQENTLRDLGMDPGKFDLESERGKAMADFDIDERVEALRAAMTAGEGVAWKDKVAKIVFSQKAGKTYTTLRPEAVPGVMHADGKISEKGLAMLKSAGWEIWDEAK